MYRFLAYLFLLLPALATAQSAPVTYPGESPQAYVLRPGDRIDISYIYTPEYNQSVLVTPDGSAGLTRLGPVRVVGLTLAAATRRITEAATRSGLNKPELFVTLTDYVRPQFTVVGQVNKPGRFEMRGPVRIAEGLAMAGGLNQMGRRKNLILIHPISETEGVTTLIDYKKLEKNQKNGVTLEEFQAGDILVVPSSTLSQVERFIRLINVGVFYNPVP